MTARIGEHNTTEPTLQSQIEAANAYEALFVPAPFGYGLRKSRTPHKSSMVNECWMWRAAPGFLRVRSPYEQDQFFNAVVSQFGLMFFTDRRQTLREMPRVPAPGGH
jgi:hypothetical protein